MIGEKVNTKYFGTYIEYKQSDIPVRELVGKVSLRAQKDDSTRVRAYLYVKEGDKVTRYDAPDFMQKYAGRRVAVLCRPFTKRKAGTDKVYYKLIVISVKDLIAATVS